MGVGGYTPTQKKSQSDVALASQAGYFHYASSGSFQLVEGYQVLTNGWKKCCASMKDGEAVRMAGPNRIALSRPR